MLNELIKKLYTKSAKKYPARERQDKHSLRRSNPRILYEHLVGLTEPPLKICFSNYITGRRKSKEVKAN